MKISAIKCPTCKDTIFSRAPHDYRPCSCGEVAIDGGFDYVRVAWKGTPPERVQLDLDVDKRTLYNDWNKRENKWGLIEKAILTIEEKL